jgi:subtilisin family serine protease
VLAVAAGACGVEPLDAGVGSEPVGERLLVRFDESVADRRAPRGVSLVRRRALRHSRGLEIVELPPGADAGAALRAYRALPYVRAVERDRPVSVLAVPNDPRFAEQWGLENTGQGGGIADVDLNAAAAWDASTGSGSVVVVVLDTGIDTAHPDLAANLWVNPGEIAANGLDDEGNGYVDDVHGINVAPGAVAEGNPHDDNGHGTAVSGVIAARGDNGVGISGVAWQASVAACKFLDATGDGNLSGAVTCLDYVAGLAASGVNVVATNNSWGSVWFSAVVRDAIREQVEHGVLFVAAAGNSGFDNDDQTAWVYPASYDSPNIISVAVTNASDALWSVSSYGRHTVHVGAPGLNIVTTALGGTYTTTGGSSIAAPFATGLVALLASAAPEDSWWARRNLVLASGTPVPGLEAKTITGRRLRAWASDGTGALTCDGQVVATRLRPSTGEVVVARGSSVVPLEFLSIDCAEPVGLVAVASGAAEVALADDGAGVDLAAGDGSFASTFVVPGTSEAVHELVFPGDDLVTLRVLNPYREAVVATEAYRVISGTTLPIADYQSRRMTSPFPVRFGDDVAGFTNLVVADDGTVSFTDSTSTPDHEVVPTERFGTLLAPLWQDLVPSGGVIRWEVVGAAPSRELVIEWSDVLPAGTVSPVSFEVVLFEDSSDVLFIYDDVDAGSSEYDAGALATVGVQVARAVGTGFSHHQAALSNGLALRWRTNRLPVADAGADAEAMGGELVELDGSGSSDADGAETLTASWSQISGAAVTLDASSSLSPSFTAPAGEHVLELELTVTDDHGAVSRDRVIVTVVLEPEPPVDPPIDDEDPPPLAEDDPESPRPAGGGCGGCAASVGSGWAWLVLWFSLRTLGRARQRKL